MTDDTRPIAAACQGHEELRDIALETRNDVKHLTEELRHYMARKDHQDELMDSRITYLELNGAKISQENRVNVAALTERVIVLEKCEVSETAVSSLWDSVYAKAGIVVGAALGFISFIRSMF